MQIHLLASLVVPNYLRDDSKRQAPNKPASLLPPSLERSIADALEHKTPRESADRY